MSLGLVSPISSVLVLSSYRCCPVSYRPMNWTHLHNPLWRLFSTFLGFLQSPASGMLERDMSTCRRKNIHPAICAWLTFFSSGQVHQIPWFCFSWATPPVGRLKCCPQGRQVPSSHLGWTVLLLPSRNHHHLCAFRGHLHPQGISKPKNQVNTSRFPMISVGMQITRGHADQKHSPKANMEIHFFKNQFRFQRKRPFWKDSRIQGESQWSLPSCILGSQIRDGMFWINDKRS